MHVIGGPIEKPETLSPGLIRQRRNLIAISLFLIVFDFANVQIGKVSILGTELLVGKPRVLAAFAWLIWAYLIVRYYQYLRAEPDLGIKTRRFADYFHGHAFNWARRFTEEKYPLAPEEFRFERKGRRRTFFILRGKGADDSVSADISEFRYLSWKFRAGAFMALQTPYATDFILPFLIAIAAPIVTFWPALQQFIDRLK